MLAIVGLVSVLLVLFLIMSKKMTTMMALIVVPVVGDHRDLHSFPTRRSSDLLLPA